ncbi:MAG: hypothetical protein U1F36_21465 [Planctomycetota bacterium]
MSARRKLALGSLSIALLLALDAWHPLAPVIALDRLQLPSLGSQRISGAEVAFVVGGPVDGLEFRFWVRGDGDWTVAQDWSPVPSFAYAPQARSTFSFQVDVKATRHRDADLKHWIGTTTVGPLPKETPIAEAIRVTPDVANLGPTREIVMDVKLGPRTSIPALRVRLTVGGIEVAPWQPWAGTPIALPDLPDREVVCELRLEGAPDRVERHVLGRLHASPASDAPDILRLIVAGRRSRTVPDFAIDLLAERIRATGEALLSQHSTAEAPGDAPRSARLAAVLARIGWHAEGDCIAVSPTGQRMRLRAEPFLVQWDDDPLWVDLSIERHAAVRGVLDATRDLGHDLRLAILVGYLVFRSFDYAEDAPARLRSLAEPLGQCATTTGLLVDILRELRLDVRVLTVDNLGAAHALTWVRTQEGEELVIDTSEGLVFRWSPTRAGREKVPTPIEFPGRRSLGLDLSRTFDPKVTILRSSLRFAPVVPRQLEVASMRIEYRPD